MIYHGRILKRYNPGEELCEGYNNNECVEYASVQLRGETDSFGYECIDWCDSCYERSLDYRDDDWDDEASPIVKKAPCLYGPVTEAIKEAEHALSLGGNDKYKASLEAFIVSAKALLPFT